MLVRRIARPMLAAVFVAQGIDTLRNPAPRVKAAAPLVHKGEQVLPDEVTSSVPTDPETLVKINAGTQIGGGLLLATGKLPRLASVALAGTIVPTTLAGHAFWEESDPEAKAAQRLHFLKNVGLLGGLLLAAVDTEGKPSVAWRTRRQADRVAAALPGGSSHSDTTDNLRSAAHVVAERSSDLAHKAAESDTTAKLVAGSSALAATAASRAQDLAHTVATSDTTKKLADRGQDLAHAAAGRSSELAHTAAQRGSDLASDLADEGGRRGHDLAARARRNADVVAAQAERRGRGLAVQARKDAHSWAAGATGTASSRAQNLADAAQDVVDQLSSEGSRRGRKLAKKVQKKADTLSAQAADAAHEVAAEAGSRGEHAAARTQLRTQRLLG